MQISPQVPSLPEKVKGLQKSMAMFKYDSLVKSGHYILDTAQKLTSLADEGKIQVTTPGAVTYTGSAVLENQS